MLVSSSQITRCLLAGLLIASTNLSMALQVGVVNELALLNSPVMQALQKPIQAKITEQEKELESIFVQYQKSQIEFNKNELIMDAKAREQQQEALSALTKQMQVRANALEKKRRDGTQQVETLLKDSCLKVAKKNKLDIILSNKAGGVLYANAAFDVTQQVVKALPNTVVDSSASTSELNS